MDRLSHLTMILALVVLCALPLYCELKTEESLNFGVMEETGDVAEALRTKRGVQVVNYRDTPLRKRKQSKKSIKQTVDDIKTIKRRKVVAKRQSRDDKQCTPDDGAELKTDQKSDYKQYLKVNANKKSKLQRGVRDSPETPVAQEMQIVKDGVCVDDKPPIEDVNIYHSLDKRGEPKTGIKNKKSRKREIKLNTLNEIKSVGRKMEAGDENYLEKAISNKSMPINLSKNKENNGDDDDETCVDKPKPLKQIRRSKNEKPSKWEGDASNYSNTK